MEFRLMAFCHETVDRLGDKDSAFVKANITCLCRISGILTNLSHENGWLFCGCVEESIYFWPVVGWWTVVAEIVDLMRVRNEFAI